MGEVLSGYAWKVVSIPRMMVCVLRKLITDVGILYRWTIFDPEKGGVDAGGSEGGIQGRGGSDRTAPQWRLFCVMTFGDRVAFGNFVGF